MSDSDLVAIGAEIEATEAVFLTYETRGNEALTVVYSNTLIVQQKKESILLDWKNILLAQTGNSLCVGNQNRI